MATRLALVVLRSADRLVADVAEGLRALDALNQVRSSLLLVDVVAVGTHDTELDVDERVICEAQILLDHFKVNLNWQKIWSFLNALWVLLVMFLAFCRVRASPAEILPALCTLDMSATTFHFDDSSTAFAIWTQFGALLEVKLGQLGLVLYVFNLNIGHDVLELGEYVDTVDFASLERVHSLPAVEAEVEVTVLAPT
jgi:hypothetical protein